MPITVDILDPASPTTPLATLDQPYAREWMSEIYDLGGAGSLTIPHDSPVVQADRSVLNRTRIVRIMDGSTPLFAWEINGRQRTRRDVWDPIAVQGESVRALLRYALVEPEYGFGNATPTDDRVWNFATLSYDTSTAPWDDPFSLGQQQNPTGQLPRLLGQPDGWQDPRAEWLWTEALQTDGGTGRIFHPAGTVYFRRVLRNMPAGIYTMVIAGTNRWECWFDGVNIGQGGGFRDVATFTIRGYGRDTVWGLRVEKDTHAWWEWDPGAIIGFIARIDDEENADVIYRTYTDAVYDGPATPAPDPWQALGYPANVPGFTGLEILAELFDEGAGRGVFPVAWWSRGFTKVVDSAGTTPTEPRIEFVAQVGADTLLTVGQRLQEAAEIDQEVTVDGSGQFTYDAWEGRGVDRGATPDTGVDTVTFGLAGVFDVATQDGGEDRFNATLIRTSDRWIKVPNPGPTVGRREEFLSLGLAPSSEGAAVYAGKIVDEYDGDRPTVTWVAPPTLVLGPVDVGDIVVGPRLPFDGQDWDIAADWALGDCRILAISYAVADEPDEPVWRTFEVEPA